MMWLLIPLAVVSGTLGRMGGKGKPYNTLYRDIGCSIIVVITTIILFGWYPAFWWAYLMIFGLHWAAFTTYWDWLFKGEDNLSFAGAMVGLALSPVLFIDLGLWWVVLARSAALCVIWGGLNKYLPQIKGRDVVEEFTRYAVSF